MQCYGPWIIPLKVLLEEFCSDIRKLQSFSIPTGKPIDMMSIVEKVKCILSMKDVGPVMQKYSKISVQELAEKIVTVIGYYGV